MRLVFVCDDGGFDGLVELTRSSFVAEVRGLGGYPLVALRDSEVIAKNGDVRTHGLWASVTCETPGEHWSVGMEAFATGYDEPARALTDQFGDTVALGFDLEWTRDADGWRVEGDVLLGDDRVTIDCRGDVDDVAD